MENKQPSYFAIIPAEALHDERLTHLQIVLFAHISSMTKLKGYCWASNNTLAKLLRVTPRAITSNIKALKDFGYLKIELTSDNEDDDKTFTERRIYLNFNHFDVSHIKDKTTKTSPKKKSTPEPISFNDPIVQSKEQNILSDVEVMLFWDSLLKIYTPENDKSLHNPSLKKDRERVIKTFTQEEKDFILTLFTKYKPQLSIIKPWIGNFFKEHRNMEQVAAYFRSIKDVKEGTTTPKYQTRNEIKKNVLTRENSTLEDF